MPKRDGTETKESHAPRPLTDFPTRSAHLSGWPIPIHDALDAMVASTSEGDSETTRTELAAALVLDAFSNMSPTDFSLLIKRHRVTSIHYIDE